MPNTTYRTKYRTIASFTTQANTSSATWDLTPYHSAGIGTPGRKWRLVEVGMNTCYGSGVVAADGTLAPGGYIEPTGNNSSGGSGGATPCGLENCFDSSYAYEGYMELQEEVPEDDDEPCPKP